MQRTIASRITLSRHPRIASLPELHERNFLLLQRLLPELPPPFSVAVSRAPGEPELHLRVTARGRYTLGLRLCYRIAADGEQPDFWIRAYLDARVAEATAASSRPRWTVRDESDPALLDYLAGSWQRNLMLHKWLDYLLERGHGFEMAGRPRRPAT